MLSPVMPRFAAGLAGSLGGVPLAWPEGFTPFDGTPVRFVSKPPAILPIDAKQVALLIAAPAPEQAPQKVSKAPAPSPAPLRGAWKSGASPAETATKASAKAAPPPVPGVIQYDDFAKVELRVALVRAAEKVEGADKLLKLSVDAGTPSRGRSSPGSRRPTRTRRRSSGGGSSSSRTSRRGRCAASPRRGCSSRRASRRT